MNKVNHYSVPGFLASTTSSGLKDNGQPDLSLIFSQTKSVADGVFTTNMVKAAPVLLGKERIKKGSIRAIIANAGNANACTGERGLINAVKTADIVSEGLNINPEEIMVASTGVIGVPLPLNLMEKAIPGLIKDLSPHGFSSVARAIMTTDSFPKMSYFEGKAGQHPYRILGLAKGAGMIMPNMATMLSFILTDINISHRELINVFRPSVDSTFNRITVDGETSTNDMVLILANGKAGNVSLSDSCLVDFQKGLKAVMEDLADMIIKDGEGATKTVLIQIKGAYAKEEATRAARAVANSPLVKTALFGCDPNWGRIMAALGRSEIRMEQNLVQIWIDNVLIADRGLGTGKKSEEEAFDKMKKDKITITIQLNQGDFEYSLKTCDLTYDYVKINAGYRS